MKPSLDALCACGHAWGEHASALPYVCCIQETRGGIHCDCTGFTPALSEQDSEQRRFLRHLVDVVWQTARESQEVPATEWADRMIAQARATLKPKQSKADYDRQRGANP